MPHGLISARRHIHMSPDDAQRLGVRDCETVAVRIDSDGRDLEFRDVMVRVAVDFRLELHLDYGGAVLEGDEREYPGHVMAFLLVREEIEEAAGYCYAQGAYPPRLD